MIYCVTEPGWNLIIEDNSYNLKGIIKLTVGDKLYTDYNNLEKDAVTLIHVQFEFQGKVGWHWQSLSGGRMTMFSNDFWSSGHYPRCNVKGVVDEGGLVNITTAVNREIKMNSLGI